MGILIKSITISTLGLFATASLFTGCNKETVELLKVKKASSIYIGEGTPLLDKGEKGDYYIDKFTGLLYGPKSEENGWGKNPIRLINENQLSNNTFVPGKGAPKPNQGKIGDLYIDTQNLKMYGPKNDQGWGDPYDLGDKTPHTPKDEWPDYRLSKDQKTLLAWVNQRTVHIDMRTDARLKQVTTIAKEAFTPSYGLTSIIISDNVNQIEEGAFSGLPFWEVVTLPGSIKKIKKGLFNQCPRLRIINLNEGVRIIEDFALSDASFEQINIPASVRKIGGYAFANNEKLLKVTLHEGLKEIGSHAFASCSELTHFEIPESVEGIGEGAFSGCYNVNTLVLHSKEIPKWQNYHLADFEELVDIYVPDESVKLYKNDPEWEPDWGKIKPISQMPKQ